MKTTIGQTIALHRKKVGLTQEELAEKCCVTAQAVSKWEQGRAAPSTANLLALAKLYGACAEELLQEAE